MANFTRRHFLGSTLAAGAALTIRPRLSPAAAANSQVNLGLIGCGGRGAELLRSFSKVDGVAVSALCDPDEQRLGELAKHYNGAAQYRDLRKLLESDDVDAVVIATPNHWHCLAAIWALDAGKHVYVEKPLGHVNWDGRQFVAAAKRHGLVCQVGTQQRSDPMQSEIKKFLHEEKAIGGIRHVRVNRFGVRPSIGDRKTPLSPPASVDYQLWLGPAQDEPLMRNSLHYDWHWMWNTGSGEMGNWGVHILDDVRNNVFLDEVAFPSRIVAGGGRFGADDCGETPNLHCALFDTGSYPVLIAVCNLAESPDSKKSPPSPGPGSGYVVYCEGGRFEGQRGGAVAFDSDGKKIRSFKGDSGAMHQQNFVDALRSGNAAAVAAPPEMGHHSTEWCNLANVAYRVAGSSAAAETMARDLNVLNESASLVEQMRELGRLHGHGDFRIGPVLHFDGGAEEFTGEYAEQGNALLRRDDRKGFEIPDSESAAAAG
jgi:predicted dehydrogenase